MSEVSDAFRQQFRLGEMNRMWGTGGEVLVKAPENRNRGQDTRIEIGDRLIGIGMTHFVQHLEQPPGLANPLARFPPDRPKMAARAFQAHSIVETPDGVELRFRPLAPVDYAALIDEVSGGDAGIDPDTIPEGTMILSFLMGSEPYSLERIGNSPGENWRAVLAGERHWNVGIREKQDFWFAKFPSVDVAAVGMLAPWEKLGRIRFGLSLLPGSQGAMTMERIPTEHPEGGQTLHDFCLEGQVTGTRGLETDFYIGLATEIRCKPVA